MSIIARTPRLTIRTWKPEDAPAVLALYSDPEVTRFIPHVQIATMEQAEEKIRMMDAFYPTLWAVEENGKVIGVCGFRQGEPEIGFAFAKATWGKGYAGEAAAECLRWGAAHGMPHVIAKVRGDNAASRRALERIGFTHDGKRDGDWFIYEWNAA